MVKSQRITATIAKSAYSSNWCKSVRMGVVNNYGRVKVGRFATSQKG